MSYPAPPRSITVSTADLAGVTALEWARVSVLAGAPQSRLVELAQVAITKRASPEEIELGMLVLYAATLQLERRLDPALSWAEAQTWDVRLVRAPAAELATLEAESDAEAAVAMLTGTPVAARAGDVTGAQVAAFERAHERARKAAPRARARR